MFTPCKSPPHSKSTRCGSPSLLRPAWWLLGAFCALLLLACGQTKPAEPFDAVTQRSWLADPNGQLSAAGALAGEWTAFSGTLSRGFTTSVTWLRLKLDPARAGPTSLATDHRLVLRILPAVLDEVTVFRADRPGHAVAVVGDEHPAHEPQQGLLHHAVVFEQATQPFEVLLRVQSRSNHSVHVEAQRWDAARDAVAAQENLVTAYMVFTTLVMVLVAAAWWARRSRVEALFLAHQASALAVACTLLGVLRIHGPTWLASETSTLASLAMAASTVVTLFFHAALLKQLGTPSRYVRRVQAAAQLAMLAFVLIVMGWVSSGLVTMHVSVLLALPLVFLGAWNLPGFDALQRNDRIDWKRIVILAIYGVMNAAIIPPTLRVLGLLSAGPWSFAGYTIYGLASTILLGILFLISSHQERQRRALERQEVAATRQKEQVQRSVIAEQSDLMAMLAHELKTPLSVLGLALDRSGQTPAVRERAQRAIHNMRDVIDRCEQVIRVDDADNQTSLAHNMEAVDVSALVQDLVNLQIERSRLSLDCMGHLATCMSEPTMLQIVISNLLENALKYSPADSTVNITIRPEPRDGRAGLMVQVTNLVGASGHPDPSRLFEKYHRGPRARHRSGSGLGLYLAQRICQRLGASINLHPSNPHEVCFRLWIPNAPL